jgi:hypothetical protein
VVGELATTFVNGTLVGHETPGVPLPGATVSTSATAPNAASAIRKRVIRPPSVTTAIAFALKFCEEGA